MTRRRIGLKVNGEEWGLEIEDNAILLDVLRDGLGLKAAREGCGVGACGSCTVLVDGNPISSCLTLVRTLPDGAKITTVEGLANGSGQASETSSRRFLAARMGRWTDGLPAPAGPAPGSERRRRCPVPT